MIISVIGDGTGKFKIRLNYVDGLDAFYVIDSSSLMEAESRALDIASKRYEEVLHGYEVILDELNRKRYYRCGYVAENAPDRAISARITIEV